MAVNWRGEVVDTNSTGKIACALNRNVLMHGKTIVVVDDERHVLQILSYKLKKAGAVVLTASNGEDGLVLVREHRPDLVLTDYQMPILDGYEMAVKLREDPETRQTPLILLTARGHKLSQEQLDRTNVCHMMTKPFSATELLERAHAILCEAESRNESPGMNAA